MPATHALVCRLRDAGLPAVVSGAGPSVLAFLGEREHRHDLDKVGSIASESGIAWLVSSLDVERQGARILHPVSPPGC
jgi:homoserine kinase